MTISYDCPVLDRLGWSSIQVPGAVAHCRRYAARGAHPGAERVEPEELVDLLNQYLTAITEIVFENGGTLDKYVGDALMVFFGSPVPYDDNAARAVETALRMRHRLAEL